MHLNWLGYPIVNDPLYGPNDKPNVKGYGQPSEPKEQVEGGEGKGESESLKRRVTGVEKDGQKPLFLEEDYDEVCFDCKNLEYTDTDYESICLHALSYASSDWKYTAPAPEWASSSPTPAHESKNGVRQDSGKKSEDEVLGTKRIRPE